VTDPAPTRPPASRPSLSVVTSLYGSAATLEAFHREASAAASRLTSDYELILVNDGSPDNSLQIALEIRRRDPRTRIIDLSRNFGHHKALMTGLARARGDLVFLLDSDLEEDPAWLASFREVMASTGADVVYGVQSSRKGGLFERMAGAVYYRIFNQLLTHPFPRNVVTARLMTRRYVQALVQHRDQEICLAGLWMMTGFDQRPVTIVKKNNRRSSYSVRRRLSVLINAITSFSNRPLIYIFQIGMFVIALSLAAGMFLLYRGLTRGSTGVPGWASIMISIWFLGGLTIFCIGIIGIYLAKVFTETKDRPYTVIREEFGAPIDSDVDRVAQGRPEDARPRPTRRCTSTCAATTRESSVSTVRPRAGWTGTRRSRRSSASSSSRGSSKTIVTRACSTTGAATARWRVICGATAMPARTPASTSAPTWCRLPRPRTAPRVSGA
jgi:putative glycosyltransferase